MSPEFKTSKLSNDSGNFVKKFFRITIQTIVTDIAGDLVTWFWPCFGWCRIKVFIKFQSNDISYIQKNLLGENSVSQNKF